LAGVFAERDFFARDLAELDLRGGLFLADAFLEADDLAFEPDAFFAFVLRLEELARRWAAGMSERTTAPVSCLI
jgi:hypothetical protein